ncbi:hypothetical protein BKA69DRAFT_1085843 [Paraphysoderma sedebokerense]|nr:hypothetical protein BKA69DRAFT_1085843 [Paraphysoderma sedebokerense]
MLSRSSACACVGVCAHLPHSDILQQRMSGVIALTVFASLLWDDVRVKVLNLVASAETPPFRTHRRRIYEPFKRLPFSQPVQAASTSRSISSDSSSSTSTPAGSSTPLIDTDQISRDLFVTSESIVGLTTNVLSSCVHRLENHLTSSTGTTSRSSSSSDDTLPFPPASFTKRVFAWMIDSAIATIVASPFKPFGLKSVVVALVWCGRDFWGCHWGLPSPGRYLAGQVIISTKLANRLRPGYIELSSENEEDKFPKSNAVMTKNPYLVDTVSLLLHNTFRFISSSLGPLSSVASFSAFVYCIVALQSGLDHGRTLWDKITGIQIIEESDYNSFLETGVIPNRQRQKGKERVNERGTGSGNEEGFGAMRRIIWQLMPNSEGNSENASRADSLESLTDEPKIRELSSSITSSTSSRVNTPTAQASSTDTFNSASISESTVLVDSPHKDSQQASSSSSSPQSSPRSSPLVSASATSSITGDYEVISRTSSPFHNPNEVSASHDNSDSMENAVTVESKDSDNTIEMSTNDLSSATQPKPNENRVQSSLRKEYIPSSSAFNISDSTVLVSRSEAEGNQEPDQLQPVSAPIEQTPQEVAANINDVPMNSISTSYHDSSLSPEPASESGDEIKSKEGLKSYQMSTVDTVGIEGLDENTRKVHETA